MALVGGNSLWWQARLDNTKLQKDTLKTQSIFKQLGTSIGKGAIFAGVGIAAAAAIKKVVKVNVAFEKSISTLSSLTGAVGEDLDFYKDKAIQFGESTTQSASQVADAFKLIGSQKPELLKSKEALASVTREAITLSEAAQITAEEAGSALTNSLNQMSAGAEQSGKYINILASASQLGAGNIPYLNSAIEKSGKVAHDANLSFAEMTSVIEQLAPSFKEPTTAGLYFKNILLRLQTQGFGFSSGMFDLQDALHEVQGELDGITDPAKKAAKQTEIFGLRSITAGKIMLETKDKFKDFSKEISGTNTAYEQAKTNTDNVEGSITKLKSAVEGAILKNSDFNAGLKDIIDSLTDVVKWLGNNWELIQKVAETYLIYKATVIGLRVAQQAYNYVLKIGTLLQRGLNKAMRANIIGLIVAGLFAAIEAYKYFNRESDKTKNSLIDLNKIGSDYETTVADVTAKSKTLFDELKNTKKGTDAHKKALKQVNETYKDYLPNLLTNKSSLDEINKAQKNVNDELTRNIAIESQRNEIINLTKKYFENNKGAYDEFLKLNTQGTAITFEWIKASVKAGVSINSMADAISKATGYSVRFGTLQNIVRAIQRNNKKFDDGKKNIEDYYNSAIKTLNLGLDTKKPTNDGDGGYGGNGDKQTKLAEDFKTQQEYELSIYKLQTDNAELINLFKKQQELDYLQFKIENDKTLSDLEKETLTNKYILLRQEKDIKVNIKKQENDELLQAQESYNQHLKQLSDEQVQMMLDQEERTKATKDMFLAFGDVVMTTFKNSEASAEGFKDALKSITKQIIGMLIAKAVAKVAEAAYDKFGIAGLIVAPVLGAAAYASMNALIPKYETGGIVGGTGNKDNQLILAKPNEVVLNGNQQAKLLMNIANGGNTGNTESLLREQNDLLKNKKDAIIKDGVIYELKNGKVTGNKTFLN